MGALIAISIFTFVVSLTATYVVDVIRGAPFDEDVEYQHVGNFASATFAASIVILLIFVL